MVVLLLGLQLELQLLLRTHSSKAKYHSSEELLRFLPLIQTLLPSNASEGRQGKGGSEGGMEPRCAGHWATRTFSGALIRDPKGSRFCFCSAAAGCFGIA